MVIYRISLFVPAVVAHQLGVEPGSGADLLGLLSQASFCHLILFEVTLRVVAFQPHEKIPFL